MRTMIVTALAVVFGLTWAPVLEAQGTAKPFTTKKVTQEEYARAIEKNERSILYIDANEIANAGYQTVRVQFADRYALADWIRELEVRRCPQETVQLARIFTVPTRRVDTNGWKRPLRADEMCLYADNRPVVSLDCGNFIIQPFPVEKVTARVTQPVVPEPIVPRVDRTPFVTGPTLVIPDDRSWLSRNWGWPVGILGAIAGGCIVADIAFDRTCIPGNRDVRQVTRIKIK